MSAQSGLGGLSPSIKLWNLVDLDRNEAFFGQFLAEGVSMEVGAELAVVSSINRQDPIVQWVAGKAKRITFTARMWANHRDDNIDGRIERLMQLCERQDDLRRPPICVFMPGFIPSLQIDCLIESLGGVSYEDPRDDGSTRGVTFSITLVKYVDVPLEATDPSKPETFTRIRRARTGDTYESIAADEYGDAALGVLLRQLNPRAGDMDLANLREGDGIHVFPQSHLRTLPFEPEHHALKSGPENEAAEGARRDLFDLRGAPAFSTVYADTSAGAR